MRTSEDENFIFVFGEVFGQFVFGGLLLGGLPRPMWFPTSEVAVFSTPGFSLQYGKFWANYPLKSGFFGVLFLNMLRIEVNARSS